MSMPHSPSKNTTVWRTVSFKVHLSYFLFLYAFILKGKKPRSAIPWKSAKLTSKYQDLMRSTFHKHSWLKGKAGTPLLVCSCWRRGAGNYTHGPEHAGHATTKLHFHFLLFGTITDANSLALHFLQWDRYQSCPRHPNSVQTFPGFSRVRGCQNTRVWNISTQAAHFLICNSFPILLPAHMFNKSLACRYIYHLFWAYFMLLPDFSITTHPSYLHHQSAGNSGCWDLHLGC